MQLQYGNGGSPLIQPLPFQVYVPHVPVHPLDELELLEDDELLDELDDELDDELLELDELELLDDDELELDELELLELLLLLDELDELLDDDELDDSQSIAVTEIVAGHVTDSAGQKPPGCNESLTVSSVNVPPTH